MSFLNTIFYYLDVVQEYTAALMKSVEEINEDGIIGVEYIFEDDVFLVYYYKTNKEYCVVIKRDYHKSPQQVVDECLRSCDTTDYLMIASMNGIDVTTELNGFMGPGGKHLEYCDKIKISWILTDDEVDAFKTLSITDMMCDDYEYVSVDRFIQFD